MNPHATFEFSYAVLRGRTLSYVVVCGLMWSQMDFCGPSRTESVSLI